MLYYTRDYGTEKSPLSYLEKNEPLLYTDSRIGLRVQGLTCFPSFIPALLGSQVKTQK